MKGAIRILIVNESPILRRELTRLLARDKNFSVMAAVADPFFAARKIELEVPDLIILDTEMPRMNGLNFLRKLMAQMPLPVLIASSKIDLNSSLAESYVAAGAMDIIVLPQDNVSQHFETYGEDLLSQVRRAALGVFENHHASREQLNQLTKHSADVMLPAPTKWSNNRQTERVICIGASTGGTDSLRLVLEKVPLGCPGIVIVQHMPENFTSNFAERLDAICKIKVREAKDGDAVLPNQALVAPGDKHMMIRRSGNSYIVDIRDGPLVSRHRPSVDVLFRSAARAAGRNAVGVIMTGMGDDGAQGLLEMRQSGALTIAEHESTCVVYGMPKEAIARNAAMLVVPLPDIAQKMLVNRKQK